MKAIDVIRAKYVPKIRSTSHVLDSNLKMYFLSQKGGRSNSETCLNQTSFWNHILCSQ